MHNLPPVSTPFVGRQDELAEITRLLTDPTCRLLTLVGPGGIGKTRLALEAARVLLAPPLHAMRPKDVPVGGRGSGGGDEPTFPNGVYLVPLQALSSPDFIVPAIADALHFQFYPGGEPKQQLLDYLREKSLLLVLDNFEHLLDGAEIVSDILTYAPYIKLLTTSRERLNLVEEWVLNVEGLPVPTSEVESEIGDYGAVQLFLQSAQRVHVGFKVTDTQKPAVARICRLVGGMPLGIELASAWVRALPCEEIAAEIERSLDILATPARNVEPRHRNMRAALEHSWNLLTDNERDVFKKLSVFRGGFRKEAAQVVAGASLQMLSALVDKSMLRVDGNGRYAIHELLYQYGAEQLAASPEEREHTRNLHSQYYAEFMGRQWEHLQSHQQREALGKIEVEIDNVRAAWHWMVENRSAEELYQSAHSLRYFAELRGRYSEALEMFGQAADALRSASLTKENRTVYALMLALQGLFYLDFSSADKGKALAEESLAILRPLNDPEVMITALDTLRQAVFFLNHMTEAEQATQEGLQIAREHGDLLRVARFLNNAGQYAKINREYTDARRFGQEALEIAEAFGDPAVIAYSCWLLGDMARELGDFADAGRRYEQSLHYYQESGKVWGIAINQLGLGKIAVSLKNFAEARRCFRQTLIIDLQVGSHRWQTDTLLNITHLPVAEGQKEWAVELLALVLHHPATMQYNRDSAEQRLATLQAELAPAEFDAAVQRGRARDLETTVTGLIADFSEHVSVAAPLAGGEFLPDDLTERELEVLHLIAQGMTNRQIGERLFLAVGTVKFYASQIYGKLHVENRVQAVARARELNLLA